MSKKANAAGLLALAGYIGVLASSCTIHAKERITLDVYPPIQMVGKDTYERVRITVDPQPENYGVDLVWESNGTFDASWINLHGESGPGVITRFVRVREPGEYSFTAVLRPANIRISQTVHMQ